MAGGGPPAPAGTELSLLPGGRACPNSRQPALLRAWAPTQRQTRVPPEGPVPISMISPAGWGQVGRLSLPPPPQAWTGEGEATAAGACPPM